jgi:hypothetical protein
MFGLWLVVAACVDPAPAPSGDSAAPDAPGPLAACPTFAEGVSRGTVASPEVVELSGLVASRARPGVWWGHNDSGDRARLFAIGDDGADLGEVSLPGVAAADWEDVAVGPDGEALYVGDIGDNFLVRTELWIWRVAEPDPSSETTEAPEKLRLRYPDGPHDAESLVVDPLTGDLYVITKAGTGSIVYVAEAPVVDGAELAEVARITLPADGLATAADVSPDGAWWIVRSYGGARLWRRGEGWSVADAFATEPCAVPMADEPSGEAVAFAADGSGFATISEGAGATVWWYAVEPSP